MLICDSYKRGMGECKINVVAPGMFDNLERKGESREKRRSGN